MEQPTFIFDCEAWLMTINNKNIKIIGTFEKPWISGKELCEALGYKDVKSALIKNVKNKHKKPISELFEEKKLAALEAANFFWPFTSEIKYHEGKAVYISEHGAYHLAMKCELPIGDAFRDWLAEDVIPSIRKTGQYKLQQQLTDAMEQLEQEKIKVEQVEQRAAKAERKALRVSKFMNRITVREHKMEWIYIGTTRQYSLERLFKIGSTTRLTSRIPQYNTGRPGAADPFYYAWAMKCFNSKDLDYHIQKLLIDFKYNDPKKVLEEQNKDNRAEMYHGIKFTDLRDILTFIINNYDASIEYLTNFIKMRLDQSNEEEDSITPPMDLKRVKCLIGDHEEEIDIEKEDEALLRKEFENILINLKEQNERNKKEVMVIDRANLVNQLTPLTNDTKKNLWTRIKELTGWMNSKSELNTTVREESFIYKIKY